MTGRRKSRAAGIARRVAGAAAALAIGAAAIGTLIAGVEDPAWKLVLARVNGDPITLGEIREAFASRHEGHGSLLVGDVIIREVIGKAVDERLLIEEGERMGVREEPGFVHAVERYRDRILVEEYRRRRVVEPSEATPDETAKAYALLPRRLRMRMIETRTEKEAREARLRITLGESFDDVARMLSLDRSRNRGGDIGWVSWGMLDEDTERVALAMKPGALSEPIPEGGRFRILSLTEEQHAEPPPLAKVEEKIRSILRGRKMKQVETAVFAAILASHPPEEDREPIATLLEGAKAAEGAPPAAKEEAGGPDPDRVLIRTAGGITVTAGQVRRSAAESRLSIEAAWKLAREEALLLDDARRRLANDPEIRRRTALYGDGLVRSRVEQVILSRLTVTDEAVRAFHGENPGAFAGPASFHLQHIVLATREEAEDVVRRLAAGENFGALARQRSIDAATAGKGGDMGWIQGPAGDPAARDGIFALPAGATSEIIPSDLGFSVVKIVAIREAPVPEWSEIKEEAAKRYLGRERAKLREAFLTKLYQAAEIEILEDAIPRAVSLQDDFIARRTGKPSS